VTPPENVDPGALVAKFRAMAQVSRLTILATLRGNEYSVAELGERTGIRQPGLSQQLGILRRAGAVETRRKAKSVLYRVNPQIIVDLENFIGALQSGAVSKPRNNLVERRKVGSGAAMFARIVR